MPFGNRPVVEKPLELEKVTFEPPIFTYTGEIAEVKIGATANEGGTRKKVIKIGGEKSPAFYRFENPTPNRPVVALDVFDELPPLPKTIKEWGLNKFPATFTPQPPLHCWRGGVRVS